MYVKCACDVHIQTGKKHRTKNLHQRVEPSPGPKLECKIVLQVHCLQSLDSLESINVDCFKRIAQMQTHHETTVYRIFLWQCCSKHSRPVGGRIQSASLETPCYTMMQEIRPLLRGKVWWFRGIKVTWYHFSCLVGNKMWCHCFHKKYPLPVHMVTENGSGTSWVCWR